MPETQKSLTPHSQLMNEKYTFVYAFSPHEHHKNAQSAAYHAEAAAKQGKFYGYRSHICDTDRVVRPRKPEVSFMTIATDLGLDPSKFSTMPARTA
jgi:hypothetical protein